MIYRECQHMPHPTTYLNEVLYYTSSRDGIMDFDGDLVINLTGIPNINNMDKYPELVEYIEYPFQEMLVPCPVFHAPKVKMDFWRAIHSFIESKKWKHICIQCDTAHGRTGTFLASLIIANAGMNAKDAVDLIRAEYCELAVETMEQCVYLQQVDEYYNKRKPTEENCPMPSLFFYPKEDEGEDS